MFIGWFTEQPMSSYPEDEAHREGGLTVLTFSNRHFDPDAAAQLYANHLEQYRLADAVGFDGIVTNEHHNSPFGMQAQAVVWPSILAAATHSAQIVPLGVPLPLHDNPLQVAESLAMIDMISGGRLVAGIVRGGGTEQYAMNANPAYNRARFEEAHDLLIKTWTTPGPFRWEGDQYQFRVVNPWAVPMQKPHPRIWVPGTSSNETIEWAARHRYPYIGRLIGAGVRPRLDALYGSTARNLGYEAGPECFGELVSVIAQDTEERALQNAEQFDWMTAGISGLAHPVWSTPAGFLHPARRMTGVLRANGRVDPPGMRGGRGARRAHRTREQFGDDGIIAGTPAQVIDALRDRLAQSRPGIFLINGSEGRMSHPDTMRSIELLGTQVLPALHEIANALGLHSPDEAGAPVSLAYPSGPARRRR
ncbi:MAG: LLM class flavin-dependent oxidoreductase [Dehalococcoidia bacterium]|nr:LLM class flavin-dependent oxidoreductase [Dehalococcoidia bacterium]